MDSKDNRIAALSLAACLGLAGCGGDSGGIGDMIGDALTTPLPGTTLSAEALSQFFVQSFATFETAAQNLRGSDRYRFQQNNWYVDSNNDGQRNPGSEPLHSSYPLASARIEYAHAAGLTGRGATIAILDEGFRPSHEALAGRLAYGAQGLALDSHGTAVASVAAGNSGQMIGVAPGANLAYGTYESAASRAAATNLAAAVGAVVQNNSWGFLQTASAANFRQIFVTGQDSVYLAALENYARDGVVVFAASNDRNAGTAMLMEALPLHRPALEPGWLTVVSGVAEFDHDRILSAQRVSAPCLQAARWCLAAEGTWTAASAESDVSYSLVTGASFAAPMVSGAIALLAEAFPDLSPHDLRARLIASADNGFAGFTAAGSLEVIPGSGFHHDYSTEWGHGFLDLRAALLPIGATTALMADGRAHDVSGPMILSGGATGDAVTRSLAATAVLVTDALGGDFTMPGAALAATALPAPVSERLWPALSGPVPRSAVMREYGGSNLVLHHGDIELSLMPPAGGTARAGFGGADPAMGAAIGQSLETRAGDLFIGLSYTRDDGTLMPGGAGVATHLAALELGLSSRIGQRGFVELGGSLGLAPGGSGGPGGAIPDRSDIRFNSFRAEAGRTGVLRAGDRLSLGLALPVAVTSGGGRMLLPVARGAGGIEHRSIAIDYAPRNREVDLSITYGTPLGHGRELFVGAIHAINHGHIAGRQDSAAILGLRMAF